MRQSVRCMAHFSGSQLQPLSSSTLQVNVSGGGEEGERESLERGTNGHCPRNDGNRRGEQLHLIFHAVVAASPSYSLLVSGPKYLGTAQGKEPLTISLVLAVGRSITSLLTFGARGESRSVGARANTCPARKRGREGRAVKGFLRNDCRDIRRGGQQAEEGWRSPSLSPSKAGREHRFAAFLLLPSPLPIWPSFGLLPRRGNLPNLSLRPPSSTPSVAEFICHGISDNDDRPSDRPRPAPLGTTDGVCMQENIVQLNRINVKLDWAWATLSDVQAQVDAGHSHT